MVGYVGSLEGIDISKFMRHGFCWLVPFSKQHPSEQFATPKSAQSCEDLSFPMGRAGGSPAENFEEEGSMNEPNSDEQPPDPETK